MSDRIHKMAEEIHQGDFQLERALMTSESMMVLAKAILEGSDQLVASLGRISAELSTQNRMLVELLDEYRRRNRLGQ